jgi:Flp pilus assembly protein TadD
MPLGGGAIVENVQVLSMVRFRLTAAVLFSLTIATSVAYADARSDSKAQVEFGIAAAQRELWKEALYRWKRAVELDPTYAAAYNNLAIAHEHEGEFDEARKAYERAIELEPENTLIKQNYDLFREINDRTNRNGDR